MSKDVVIEDHFMTPSAAYPDGSYMRKVAGEVQVATGYYATIHPGKPSLYWHGGPPCVMVDTSGWNPPPWESEK